MPSRLPQPLNLALAGLLVLLCIYTALATWLPLTQVAQDYHTIALGGATYAGFLAVAGCCISYVSFPRFFRRALGATLLLALFNLISFLPFTTSVGLIVGETRLGINPLVLLLLAVFYCFNRKAANAFIREHLLPRPSPQQAANQYRAAIDQFKQTFARKSDDSLRQIVQERKLVAAAVAAAQELLTERGELSVLAK